MGVMAMEACSMTDPINQILPLSEAGYVAPTGDNKRSSSERRSVPDMGTSRVGDVDHAVLDEEVMRHVKALTSEIRGRPHRPVTPALLSARPLSPARRLLPNGDFFIQMFLYSFILPVLTRLSVSERMLASS